MSQPQFPDLWSLSRPAVYVEAMTLAERHTEEHVPAARPAGWRGRIAALAAGLAVLCVVALAGLGG